MMFAAAVGHRSGRATPSLRDAPQRQSMEIVGGETIYRNRNAVQTNPATSIARGYELSTSCPQPTLLLRMRPACLSTIWMRPLPYTKNK